MRSAHPNYNLLTRAIGITTPARFNHLDARGWHDFPAHGYSLDDDAPACELSVERPQFEPVPLKYGFYLLAQELDKTAMQHPIARSLAFYNSSEFRGKLYSGLVALLRSMRARMEVELPKFLDPAFRNNTANPPKDEICVTLPGQWNSAFREVYLDVLADAFDIPRDTANEYVTFITNSDAWAHMMFGPVHGNHCHRSNAIEEVSLILDFGGHMMVR